MKQILQSSQAHHNNRSSVCSPTSEKLSYLPRASFAKLKAYQHAEADKAMREMGYKTSVRATMHELINFCDRVGDTAVSQETLAKRLYCSSKTIERHIAIFKKDGLVGVCRRGWKLSNKTSLLFLQHWKHNITDKMSYYLTPQEGALKRRPSLGEKEEENKRADRLADAPTAQESEIWDDKLDIQLTEEQKENGSARLAAMRAMFNL